MEYNILDEWRKLTLSQLGEVVGGGTPSTKKAEYYEGGKVSWLTPKDLSGYTSKYISKGERNITELGLKNSSAKLLPEGTVLFSSRAPIGYIAIALNKISTNQGFKSIIPNKHVTTSDFIYYLLIYNTEKIKNISSGSTFKEVSGTMMKNFEVLLPPFKEQIKISKILSSLDDKIETNNAIIANLEDQAQAIFKSWFIDFEPFQDGEFVESELGMIPKGWEVKKIKEISVRRNGYTYKSSDLNNESDINMLTLKSFNRTGGLNFESEKPLIKTSRIKDFHYLDDYDILVACTDLTQSADVIGRAILYVKNYKFTEEIYSMDLVKIEPRDKESTFYIFSCLTSQEFKKYSESVATGTTVLHLPKKEIDDFKILYPKKEIINEFSKIIRPIFEQINNYIYQNINLAQLRDTLLPKLMSGEIRVGQESTEALENIEEIDESKIFK